MSKTKKELEAELAKLEKENVKLSNILAKVPEPVEVVEPEKVTAAVLLPLVEPLAGEVAQLKHLELKIANAPEKKSVLIKQYEGQKSVVNELLSKLNLVV